MAESYAVLAIYSVYAGWVDSHSDDATCDAADSKGGLPTSNRSIP